jgi:catechol 2,3-dioxygenase-like lactoylglutathione lyase family enzyme
MNTLSLAFNNLAIVVTDMERAIKWYESVLGMVVESKTFFEPIQAHVTFMRGAGVALELLAPPKVTKIPELYVDPPAHAGFAGYKALVFDVADLVDFTTMLREKSVIILWENHPLNDKGLRSTLFRDPDGNLVNVFNRP